MLIDTNLFSDGFSVFFLDFLMAWFNKSERLKPAESRNMILWWTSIITLHCSMFKTSKVKNKYACFIVFDNTSHPATLSPISSSQVFFWSELARTSLFAWKQIFLKKSVDGINNGQRSLLPAPRYRYSMPNLQCFCVFKLHSVQQNHFDKTVPGYLDLCHYALEVVSRCSLHFHCVRCSIPDPLHYPLPLQHCSPVVWYWTVLANTLMKALLCLN